MSCSTPESSPPTASAPDFPGARVLLDRLALELGYRGVWFANGSIRETLDAAESLLREKQQIDSDEEWRRVRVKELEAEVERLTGAIRWALGEEGEFPLWDDGGDDTRRPADGKRPRIGYFWWRAELRRRAFGDEEVTHG